MTTPHDSTSTQTRRVLRRWWPILVIVAIAAAAALWPGTSPRPTSAAPSSVPRPPVDLVAARARAQLRPCPPPQSTGPSPTALRGVQVTCLGDGASVDLGAAVAGRTTVINVWASWCGPCRDELPVLDAYATSPGAVQVLGVQVQSDPADGLDLLTSLNVHLPSVIDSDGAVSTALHAPAYLPVSYVVTADGALRQVLPPTPFSSPEQVARTVRALSSGHS